MRRLIMEIRRRIEIQGGEESKMEGVLNRKIKIEGG